MMATFLCILSAEYGLNNLVGISASAKNGVGPGTA
jgi:hypothetical protein